jgi:hypothetical protein
MLRLLPAGSVAPIAIEIVDQRACLGRTSVRAAARGLSLE